MENQINNSLSLEQKIDNSHPESDPNSMKFWRVFKSMIPSIVVGTMAATGCQAVCSRYTENPELITLAGMAGQYIGGYGAFFPSYFYNNKDRLIKNRKIKWKLYLQEIGSVIASDRIGNKVWAGAYGLTNELSLRAGLNSSYSGLISGITSGLTYTAFTSAFAPKINSCINYFKKKLIKNKNPTKP